MNTTPVIFFSYSRRDSEFALRLGRDLRAAGVRIWLDQLDIKPGQRWDAVVEESLTECARLLVILSSTSVESANVLDEVSYALEGGKPVIPIIIQDCAIPFRLRRLQHIDFRSGYDAALERLVQSLSGELGQVAPGVSVERATTESGAHSTERVLTDAPVHRSEPSELGRAANGLARRKPVWLAAAVLALGAAVVGLAAARHTPMRAAQASNKDAADRARSMPKQGLPPAVTASAGTATEAKQLPRVVLTVARAELINAASRLCLSVAGGSTERDTELVQNQCGNEPARLWHVAPIEETDFVSIKNVKSGLCLTLAGGGTDKNTVAIQGKCEGDPSVRWRLQAAAEGAYELVNVRSKLCLTLASGVSGANATAVQLPCDGDPARAWKIDDATASRKNSSPPAMKEQPSTADAPQPTPTQTAAAVPPPPANASGQRTISRVYKRSVFAE